MTQCKTKEIQQQQAHVAHVGFLSLGYEDVLLFGRQERKPRVATLCCLEPGSDRSQSEA